MNNYKNIMKNNKKKVTKKKIIYYKNLKNRGYLKNIF